MARVVAFGLSASSPQNDNNGPHHFISENSYCSAYEQCGGSGAGPVGPGPDRQLPTRHGRAGTETCAVVTSRGVARMVVVITVFSLTLTLLSPTQQAARAKRREFTVSRLQLHTRRGDPRCRRCEESREPTHAMDREQPAGAEQAAQKTQKLTG